MFGERELYLGVLETLRLVMSVELLLEQCLERGINLVVLKTQLLVMPEKRL